MSEHSVRLGRRALIAGAGAAVAATAIQGQASAEDGAGGAKPKRPAQKHGVQNGIPLSSAPNPIPGGFDTGDPTLGVIHQFVPGPTDKVTPFLELPGEGLDAEPSTITDFNGYSAMAVVAGQVKGSDGATYDCEFDIRAYKGDYISVDGKKRYGAFAFL